MGKSLLIIVLGFSTVLGTMMFNVTSSVQSSSKVFVEQYEQMITRNAKESVANVAISKALRNAETNESFGLGNVNCDITVESVSVDSSIQVPRDLLTIVCRYDNFNDTTQVVTIYPAYSYYYYFVHRNWLATMYYETGDTVVGPVHANNWIQINGEPVFLGKVSSEKADFYGAGTAKTYGGREFQADHIHLNESQHVDALETIARNNGGHVFEQDDDLTLTFNADSTYTWTHDGVTSTQDIAAMNGVILLATETRDIHISGVVATKVTVVARRDIYVENSITYLHDPEISVHAEDYLGLVADRSIVVRPNFDNIEIDAAMLAKYFYVENYATAPPRGTLTIFGSLAVHDASDTGVMSGGTLLNGYRRNHLYDIRLIDRIPPYFPRVPNRKEVTYRSN